MAGEITSFLGEISADQVIEAAQLPGNEKEPESPSVKFPPKEKGKKRAESIHSAGDHTTLRDIESKLAVIDTTNRANDVSIRNLTSRFNTLSNVTASQYAELKADIEDLQRSQTEFNTTTLDEVQALAAYVKNSLESIVASECNKFLSAVRKAADESSSRSSTPPMHGPDIPDQLIDLVEETPDESAWARTAHALSPAETIKKRVEEKAAARAMRNKAPQKEKEAVTFPSTGRAHREIKLRGASSTSQRGLKTEGPKKKGSLISDIY